jgi:hypothetical protein
MKYQIKSIPFLRKILWADFAAGSSTGIVGLGLREHLVPVLGVPYEFIIWVSAISIVYCLFAVSLARMPKISIGMLQILIYANWIWTVISLGLIYYHFADATVLGKIFLIVQVTVAAALAYVEGKQLVKV